MQCNWTQTLFTFISREKFDGKGNQQYFKDRVESFDDYYPCIQKETMNVTYFRYKIEYHSLYICIIIQYLLGTIILLISYKKKGKFNLLIQPILIYRIIYL